MWGQWGNWTDCTKTAGGGIHSRIRLCDSPAAEHGGDACPRNFSYGETTVTVNGIRIKQEQDWQTCNDYPGKY